MQIVNRYTICSHRVFFSHFVGNARPPEISTCTIYYDCARTSSVCYSFAIQMFNGLRPSRTVHCRKASEVRYGVGALGGGQVH